jgi:3-oxoacyl-[acyl-carrier-protein] synthase II
MASAYGSLATTALFYADVLNKGPRSAKPFLFPHTYANTPISLLAIEHGLAGHHLHFASGATGSSLALLDAHDRIRTGKLDLALAGGYEAYHEILHVGLDVSGQLGESREDAPPAAPFDRDRTGFIPGEGGIVLVLEELERALARGARVYAEMTAAFCRSGDPQRDSAGFTDRLFLAMQAACAEPGLVFASANGSVRLDALEADAIRRLAGADAEGVPVTAVKAITGECFGAAGGLQAAAAALSIDSAVMPPVSGIGNPDKGLGLDLVRAPRRRDPSPVLINTLDPGGSIVTIALARLV